MFIFRDEINLVIFNVYHILSTNYDLIKRAYYLTNNY